jgi:release factor glutamine methyltransferase
MTARPGDARELAIGADTSIEAARKIMARAFAAVGLDTPDLDARLILLHVLGIDRRALVLAPDRPIGAAASALADATGRRLSREPVARIIRSSEFWGLPFALDPSTLVPRTETETLIEAALTELGRKGQRERALRILDLGTGSGAILIALLHELPHATGVGIDRSTAAVACARENAKRNGVGARACFCVADWASALSACFDLVVANPPYVAQPDIAALDPEVRLHDPLLALDGGADGFAAYEAIIPNLPSLLSPDGTTILELGAGQAQRVCSLLRIAGLTVHGLQADLAGHERVAIATNAASTGRKIHSAPRSISKSTWREREKRLSWLKESPSMHRRKRPRCSTSHGSSSGSCREEVGVRST